MTATDLPAPPRSSRFGGIVAGILALVGTLLVASAVGFYPGYFSQFPGFARSGWQVHFHLLTILAWLGLLVAQASLAATGRIAGHRALGRLSYALVPLIVLGFVLVTRFGQQRHAEPALIGAAFFDGGLFLLFYLLAIANRRNTAHHSRYMALTAVAFINPPLGRAIAPQVSVPLEFLVIVALLIAAKRRRQPWRPFLVGAVAYIVLLGIILAVNPPG
jgi:hypothetical protein